MALFYSIIERAERAENESGHQRVKGSGRVAKIMIKKNINALKAMFDHKTGVSQRQAARRFKCDQSFICKTLQRKTSIKCRHKKKIPKRTDDQKANNKTLGGRLYRNSQNISFVLDDESYFTLTNSTINGNNVFYSSDVSKTPPMLNTKHIKNSNPSCLFI